MPYRVDIRDPRDGAIDRLIELGALDAEASPDGGISALMPDDVPPERVAALLGIQGITVSPATGRDEDSVWVLSPGPIQIGRLRIVPARDAAAPGSLRLHDTRAFGTGLHPTTALCVAALQDCVDVARPEAVLDVGTGSGVLVLAALLLGVPRALGIDVDEEALRAAADNARLNGLADRLELRHAAPDAITGTWPPVLANVLAAPLIEMAPALVRRVGHHGRLVLSGIPSSVEPDVQQAYRRLGMRRVDVKARAGWIALVLQASW